MQRDIVLVRGEQDHKTGVVNCKCPSCGATKPLNDFGLRRMKGAGPNGVSVVRNQSWCRDCRSGRRKEKGS